jgi:hypothetical protein
MREQDGPSIADPFVKIDRALSGFCCEVWGFVVYTYGHGSPPGVVISVTENLKSLVIAKKSQLEITVQAAVHKHISSQPGQQSSAARHYLPAPACP